MVSFYRVPLFCALPAAGSFSDKTQKSGAAFAAPLGKNILLLFHIPIEEGDDLGAGAVVIRTEQAIADPAGLPAVDYYICPVCGYTHEGPMTEACPVCKAPAKGFYKVD